MWAPNCVAASLGIGAKCVKPGKTPIGRYRENLSPPIDEEGYSDARCSGPLLRRADARIPGKEMGKEMGMTRTDVRKLAWVLRLIGYGLLIGSAAMLCMGVQHAAAASGRSAPPPIVK